MLSMQKSKYMNIFFLNEKMYRIGKKNTKAKSPKRILLQGSSYIDSKHGEQKGK